MDTLVIFDSWATEHDIALVRWLATTHGVTHAKVAINDVLFKTERCIWLKGQKPGLTKRLRRLRNLFVWTGITDFDSKDLISRDNNWIIN